MPRDPSPRAAARALYRAAAAQAVSDSIIAAGVSDAPAAPLTETAAAVPTPLTQRSRALYEEGVVPVREIARLAGVSERTFYKYVQRGGWRRRYGKPAGKPDGKPAARGAGGHFVRSEDAGKPHACGLKALDPEGAARAVRRCDAAAALARDAKATAAVDVARRVSARATSRGIDAQMRLVDLLGAALVDLARGYARGGARYAALARDLQALIAAEMRAALRL